MFKTFGKRVFSFDGKGLRSTATAIGRFRKADNGVAAVEFALIAPLLVTLMLGALEVTQSIWADSKVEQATSAIGDLVARTPLMNDAEFQMLGEAGPLIMRPNPANDVSFTVTSVLGCKRDLSNPSSEIDFYVLWSKVWQGSKVKNSPYRVDSEFNDQPENLELSDGDTLIITEGQYFYEPTITRKIGTKIEMGGYAFHQPRDTSRRISYPSAESPDDRDCNYFRSN